MVADLEWLDTLRSRGFGRLAAPQAEAEKNAPVTTYATSNVRLAVAIKKMSTAQTLPALEAIKDAAKPGLLERDLSAFKAAYTTRYQYLRSILSHTHHEKE